MPPPAEAAPVASSTAASSAPGTSRPSRIYVDVSGDVRRPSLYLLPANSRVMQAILAAGGPAADADMDAVNLAQKVTDGEKVYVPKRTLALSPMTSTVSGEASVTASAPALHPNIKGMKGAKSSHSDKITAESGEQVSLNTATAEQLQRLPGVGPGMAERILAYRQQAGGFQKIEDLMQVTSIGPKKFAKIAPFVKLD